MFAKGVPKMAGKFFFVLSYTGLNFSGKVRHKFRENFRNNFCIISGQTSGLVSWATQTTLRGGGGSTGNRQEHPGLKPLKQTLLVCLLRLQPEESSYFPRFRGDHINFLSG